MKLTPEELQNIADDTQNLAPATFMKGRAKGPEVKLPPPQPAHEEPKSQTISEAFGLTPESFTAYRKAVKASGMSLEEYAMTHSGVEVHSKETMDEVREALKKAGDYAHFVGASSTCAACFSALAKLNPPQ